MNKTSNKSNLEKSIKILEYKLLFQEKEKVFLEFEEGSVDLNYRLSFFEKKLDKTIPSQVEAFNNKILNRSTVDTAGVVPVIEDVLEENKSDIQSTLKDETPSYVKKLYRKIAGITHPDKTSGINSKEIIENYTNLYYLAVSSLEDKDYQNILMIANDLSINISSVDDAIFNEMFDKSINKTKEEIESKKKLVGYQWYHVPEDKKNDHLKLILQNLGFIFTDVKVEEVIKSKRPINTRKVGEKPKKGVRDRRNKLRGQ